MLNSDLIAYLKPVPNCFNAHEWHDALMRVQDISVDSSRITIRLKLELGIYQGHLETKAGAFDMRTAMVEMTRAPDLTRHPVGPWDLDHLHNVMAMPMAKVWVNNKFKGGLWFSMPGPEKIAENRLASDFGFETEQEDTEIVLEFVERDRKRISWDAMEFLELRHDDRRLEPLVPLTKSRPPLYLDPGNMELSEYKSTFLQMPQFRELQQRINPINSRNWMNRLSGENNVFDIACFIVWVMDDTSLGECAKNTLLDFCRKPTWSERPDPLLMGGDNDRCIGHALYVTAMGWNYLKQLMSEKERSLVLSKAKEYLQKMYDFTLLQRGYIGCPSPDPHSLGTWHGVGVACMSFYEDLEIARRALPLFHGLFLESLKLFPPGGKTSWATFYPRWLVLYFAAACTFGGPNAEMSESAYLDHLGQTLLSCFLSPNAQESQRGLRTVEHRWIVAFLCHFHPTPGIEKIYSAFEKQELQQTGNVRRGLLDVLYAPRELPEPASFPTEPFFARDIGEVVSTLQGKNTISLLVAGGIAAGHATSFHLLPHNRETHRPMGEITLCINGTPLLSDVMGYGLYSAHKNTLCLEDGCGIAEGQYLNGDIPPEKCTFVRRYLANERFIYMDINLTQAIKPGLNVRYAQRTLLQDRQTGAIIIRDSFESTSPLRFSTHLHCSGSAHEIAKGTFRLTGGQANLIAGVKGDAKGLNDEETGEIFVQVLGASMPHHTKVEEPYWFPSYIYGVNINGGDTEESLKQAHFPRLKRWRLEANERVSQGHFLFVLATQPETIRLQDGDIQLSSDVTYSQRSTQIIALPEGNCAAEAVIQDRVAQQLVLLGVRDLTLGKSKILFRNPVDIDIQLFDNIWQGTIYSPSAEPIKYSEHTRFKPFQTYSQTRSACSWYASFITSNG